MLAKLTSVHRPAAESFSCAFIFVARNAPQRADMQAEERSSDINIIPQARYAIRVTADFCHEAPLTVADENTETPRKRDRVKAKVAGLLHSKDEERADDPRHVSDDKADSETSSITPKEPFRLANVMLRIPPGMFAPPSLKELSRTAD